MQEKQREEKIKRWFDMWLTGERQELSRLFDKNVYYSESWGPEYHGVAQLERWFDDWNRQDQPDSSAALSPSAGESSPAAASVLSSAPASAPFFCARHAKANGPSVSPLSFS